MQPSQEGDGITLDIYEIEITFVYRRASKLLQIHLPFPWPLSITMHRAELDNAESAFEIDHLTGVVLLAGIVGSADAGVVVGAIHLSVICA